MKEVSDSGRRFPGSEICLSTSRSVFARDRESDRESTIYVDRARLGALGPRAAANIAARGVKATR